MNVNEVPPWQRGDSVATVKPKVKKAAAVPASNRMSGKAKVVLILGTVALICTTVLGVVGLTKHNGTPAAAPASNTSTSLTTVAAVAADCPDSKPVSFTEHPESKARANGITGGNPEIIEVAKTDPQWMTYALTAKFPDQYADNTDWHTFVTSDGKCFNQKGLLAQAQLLGALTSSGTKHEDNVAIPTNLVNTGIGTSGAPVTNSSAGLPSGRVGTHYVFEDGSDMYVDYYCGNIPHKSVPGYTITRIPNGPPPVVTQPSVVTPPVIVQPSCEDIYGPNSPQCGYVPRCEDIYGPGAPQCNPIITTPPTTTPPCDVAGLPCPKDQVSPGNGGSGTGGFGQYGGGGAPPIDGPASAPAVSATETAAPTSRPVPTATQTTQAPTVTMTPTPKASQTTAAAATPSSHETATLAPVTKAPGAEAKDCVLCG